MEAQEKGKFEIVFSCLFASVSLLMKHLRSFLALGIFFIPFNIVTHAFIGNEQALEDPSNTPIIMILLVISIFVGMAFFITHIMLAERGGKLFINEISNDIKEHFFPLLKASILMFLYICGGAILIGAPIAILASTLSPSLALILIPIILVYVIVMSLRYMFIIYFTIFYKQTFKEAKSNSIMLINGYKFPAFIVFLVLGII